MPLPKLISEEKQLTSLFPNTSVMAELPCAAVLQDFFFFFLNPISIRGPGSEQVLILSVPPQVRNCFIWIFYVTPCELEVLLQNFWVGLYFFFSLLCHPSSPAAYLCCKIGFSQGGIHPSHPEGYIGLGWAPASVGDSWVSPKQSIAICILMKVGHCLSFNVVKWNNYFPTQWPDMAL